MSLATDRARRRGLQLFVFLLRLLICFLRLFGFPSIDIATIQFRLACRSRARTDSGPAPPSPLLLVLGWPSKIAAADKLLGDSLPPCCSKRRHVANGGWKVWRRGRLRLEAGYAGHEPNPNGEKRHQHLHRISHMQLMQHATRNTRTRTRTHTHTRAQNTN